MCAWYQLSPRPRLGVGLRWGVAVRILALVQFQSGSIGPWPVCTRNATMQNRRDADAPQTVPVPESLHPRRRVVDMP